MFIQEEIYVKYFYLIENKSVEWSCPFSTLILHLHTFPPDTVQTLSPYFILREWAPLGTTAQHRVYLTALAPLLFPLHVCAPFCSLLASGHLLFPCVLASGAPASLHASGSQAAPSNEGEVCPGGWLTELGACVCRGWYAGHGTALWQGARPSRPRGLAGRGRRVPGRASGHSGGASGWSPWARVACRGPGLSCAP